MTWTKGSRFWTVAPWIVVLSAGMSIYFNDISSFTQITMIFMGAAGAKTTVDEMNKNGKKAPTDLGQATPSFEDK